MVGITLYNQKKKLKKNETWKLLLLNITPKRPGGKKAALAIQTERHKKDHVLLRHRSFGSNAILSDHLYLREDHGSFHDRCLCYASKRVIRLDLYAKQK